MAQELQYKQLVKESILDRNAFVRAVLSGRQRGQVVPWKKVVVRPVLIKNKHHIQVSHFDERKDITKNYAGSAAANKVDELLDLPFKSLYVRTVEQEIQVQFTRKGKVLVHRHRMPKQENRPSLEHDRRKDLLLPAGEPDPFLQAIGIMTREGRVRARMRRKFTQINDFLRLVLEAGVVELSRSSPEAGPMEPVLAEQAPGPRPLHIVDCGCGNAYLSFAVYHYLHHVLRLPTRLVGIDVNRQLIDRRSQQAAEMGWTDLSFEVARIGEYEPGFPPDVVLALHACDTATDEALAQAIKWRSEMIFAAPCCHHDLQQQLADQPSFMSPVYRHGILKERLGDILTDALRALVLRIMGYHAEVIQFVSSEHTAKNLMIRARRSGQPGSLDAVAEYRALTSSFQVTPFLAHLLAKELSPFDLGDGL